MNLTSIEWTTFSANPLKYRRKSDGKVVWACVKTSPGCANCYSEAIALRYVRGKLFNAKNMEELEPFLDEDELHKMLTAKVIKGVQVSGSKCFVGDMTDVFGEWVPGALLDRLFAAFALRPDVIWQVLTKRAERMQRYTSEMVAEDIGEVAESIYSASAGEWKHRWELVGHDDAKLLPLPNVWLGVSVEDQKRADERIPHLLRTPAAVRFLSCEPLLGPVDLQRITLREHGGSITDLSNDLGDWIAPLSGAFKYSPTIDWVICGGESGHGARPMHPDHPRSLRDQCVAAGVPFFFKQWGEWLPVDETRGLAYLTGDGSKRRVVEYNGNSAFMQSVGKKAAGRLLDGRTWDEMPTEKTVTT